ncbi:MAG: hypothetical protein MZU95_13730 [Desulfomicrobium escambiense]|nr:hypothetical protein [Desulfomicrobium escambiense]
MVVGNATGGVMLSCDPYLHRLTVRVPQTLANRLRRLGEGNVSLGLRRFAAALDRNEHGWSNED